MAGRSMQTTERTERRISAAASIAICVLTVLAQIGLTVYLAVFLREKATFVYLAMELLGAAAAIRVFLRYGSPSYKLAWMCLLLTLPVAGMILFYLWGGTHQAKNLSLRRVPAPDPGDRLERQSREDLASLRRRSPRWARLAAYLSGRGFLLYRDTAAEYFGDGAAFFDDLSAHLSRAERYIFLEYYILAEGQLWDRVFAILRERVAAGVEVYLIFDDFGNLTRFSDETLQAVQDAGIRVEVFNPVHRYVNKIYFNYRDHRKIAVVDGRYAWTGGINLADEYANLVVRFGHWKDSAIRVQGEGAWGFSSLFLQMWKMLGGALDHPDEWYRFQGPAEPSPGFCQPFTDGPLNNPDDPIEDTYLQLIASAQETLYLTTPYYAVEESIQKALCIAGDAGVDVRLLIPGIPDHHKITYMVAQTYFGELLSHGVKIYKYVPGFLHAKSVMVDREVALVGSTNMDYRTFQLHFECGVLMYHSPVVSDLLADLEDVIGKSVPYTMEDWTGRSLPCKMFSSIARLGAIWL